MGLGNFLCYKTTKGLFIAYNCPSGLAITGSNFVKKGAKLEVEFCENVSKKEGGTLKFCNKEKLPKDKMSILSRCSHNWIKFCQVG
jgi:hypothetical protein